MKNNLRNKLILAMCLIFGFSAQGFAFPKDTVVINYGGTVVVPPCTLTPANISVDFGNVSPSILDSTGKYTDWKSFAIVLTRCTGVADIALTMSGATGSDPKYYATTGSASNVDVEISDVTGEEYSNGYTKNIAVKPNNPESIDISMQARLRNNGKGAATPGTVAAVITASFTYR